QALAAVVGDGAVAYAADGSALTAPNGAPATIGIAVIGEDPPYAEGMGDRTDLTIPADVASNPAAAGQAPKQAGPPRGGGALAGRPMILDAVLPYADAIVMAWFPGSEGAGITDVLFGDAAPTGNLPHSWPRSMDQIPINEGDPSYDPLYAYGFGLTY